MISMRTRSIRESLILNESWPSVLNVLSSKAKDSIRDELRKYYIDIENTPSDAVELTSSRDPRLKSGMTIFDFGEQPKAYSNKHPIAVVINGKFVVNPEVPGTGPHYYDNVPASNCSWKTILSKAQSIYHMSFDDEESRQANKELRQQRADQKKGTVTRFRDKEVPYVGIGGNVDTYTVKQDEFGRGPAKRDKIDKSGFALNPHKYIDMLAAAGIRNGEAFLQDAKNVYRQLASVAADHLEDEAGPGYWGNTNAYIDTLNRLAEAFRYLRRSLDQYNEYVEKFGEKDANSYAAGEAERYLKDLREYVKKAKELLGQK